MEKVPLSSHYWNINTIHRTKKMILRPAAVACCCQNASRQRELQPERMYWLVFQCAKQVWQNITDARLMLHRLGAQQVKTPPHHSFRLFSCYMHAPAHSQSCCLRSQRLYKSSHTCRKIMCRELAWLDGVSRGYERQVLPISCGWWWWASPGL